MRLKALLLFGCAWAAAGGGCVVTIDPPPGGGGGGGGAGTIRIRIVNTTNTTLDPEIFVSATAVSSDELFQLNRKFTRFGVGTLGLIGPRSSDDFTLSCAEVRVIGTAGGRFGDDLNNPEGSGRRVVLTQDLNIFCGDRVTFTFSRTPGGFTTRFYVD
jgi:hypothetical protein